MMRAQIECIGETSHAEEKKSIFTSSFDIKNEIF